MGAPDLDDDLYESWLGNGEETEAPVKNTDQEMKDSTNEPSVKDNQLTNRDYPTEKSDGKEVAEEGNRDKCLVESGRNQVPYSGGDVMEPAGSSRGDETENVSTEKMVVRESDALTHNSKETGILKENEMGSSEGVISDAGDAAVPHEGTYVASKPVSAKEKGTLTVEDDSDLDSFPDIIYAAPDSDCD